METDDQELNGFEQAKMAARKNYGKLDLKGMAQTMADKRAAKDKAEADLAVINAELDVLRFELIPEKMDEMGVERISFEGIGRISLTGDMLVSVKAGGKEGLFDWLKKQKLGDLIQPSINPSTLKAFVKDRAKKGLEVPTECLNVTPITRASITKA